MKIKFGVKGLLISIVIICIAAVGGFIIYKNHYGANAEVKKEYGNLSGYVKSIDSDIFRVNKQNITKKDDGFIMAESDEIVEFKCNKNTKIIKKNLYNEGKKVSEQNGNIDDIKVGKIVSVWGDDTQNNVITAETVVVFIIH